MTHQYKIISADVKNGTFVVEFEGKRPLNFWIPHDDNGFLTGDALENAIQLMYPQDADLEPKFTKFTNGAAIEALVQAVPASTPIEEQIRQQRNRTLFASDWTQLPDAQLTAEQKAAWAVYRQALRDITSQAGFPSTVDWPVAP